jgi:pimeloyl-ACP methyl ester carboxylesterase
MGHANRLEFGAALQGREALEALLGSQAEAMAVLSPADLAGFLRSLVSDVDRDALDGGLAEYWATGGTRSFRQGPVGWIDDDLAFVEPWGADLAAIAVPALVWHGRHDRHDRFVPVAHGTWLADRIPGAEGRISAEDGHLTRITRRVPEVHAWLGGSR